ncbi:mutt/nudix family protein [Bacillus methanolicus PB1]|uniref:Mutt/nudix family protein n=1 Tax=Bacillus methanolicus PB1 TaxID=997296 RepID=I3E2H7_BACMT|nr:NUDIX hydrolase [Bacillus methanolicus]EIJ80698.1 mutt/nudix family protein [Bacillus methanolicus PB1]
MGESKRGNVWLGVSGLVKNKTGEWLVVKKKYGGLKGKWSLPAGFVDANETADEAAIREVFEETGIKSELIGMIGLRTGVIRGEISDTMILFLLEKKGEQTIKIQENELLDAKFMNPEKLLNQTEETSVLLQYLLNLTETSAKPLIDGINPGDQFEYTSYKLFL